MEIGFPSVDIMKLKLHDGYSEDEDENPRMAQYWYEDIVDALEKDESKKKVGEENGIAIANRDNECDTEPTTCEYCGETPCVWVCNVQTLIAVDENEHAGTFTAGSTRRKVAYKHMFRVVNGPGQKGVRKQHFECVLKGVRALFPDASGQYMGFKEE
jgi:hypothetical protein